MGQQLTLYYRNLSVNHSEDVQLTAAREGKVLHRVCQWHRTKIFGCVTKVQTQHRKAMRYAPHRKLDVPYLQGRIMAVAQMGDVA